MKVHAKRSADGLTHRQVVEAERLPAEPAVPGVLERGCGATYHFRGIHARRRGGRFALECALQSPDELARTGVVRIGSQDREATVPDIPDDVRLAALRATEIR